MKLVFYSVVLNHHQAPLADELYNLLGDEYCFVELINLRDKKGVADDFSKRPYLISAWESEVNYKRAMELARTAECCVFSSVYALPFEKERMLKGLLSFDMTERWLKKGWKSFLSPRLQKWLLTYYLERWKNKPLYKLCMSAFAAEDHYKMGSFKGKVYKWGYFTRVDKKIGIRTECIENKNSFKLMWCARFLDWKHPELPIQLMAKFKESALPYEIRLDMYGDGVLLEKMKQLVRVLDVADYVTFHGNIPNHKIRKAMSEHDIFLFTSDKREGWGAVANEAMSEGCLLIGSDEIGAVPYLIKDGVNGLVFKSKSLHSLQEKVLWAIKHKKERLELQQHAIKTMREVWSPVNAANVLIQLIDNLKQGKDTSIDDGPCSKA